MPTFIFGCHVVPRIFRHLIEKFVILELETPHADKKEIFCINAFSGPRFTVFKKTEIFKNWEKIVNVTMTTYEKGSFVIKIWLAENITVVIGNHVLFLVEISL